ncbi:hypothetical protein BC629DRAFT_1593144 [Irpex lacteus]|nr:hypothetical protein BC629DRAFT_1593144 [Irpex lacteus]
MAPTLEALETQFKLLSIKSVVFHALSAMFGAYVVLFILALWSTHRRQGRAYKRLRMMTVLLFIVLVTHYISRAVATARARRMIPAPDEEARFTIPLQFVTSSSNTIAAFIFDSMLVWRFYVIYGRSRWALLFPAIVVASNAILGLIGNFMNFALYSDAQLYHDKLETVSFTISAAWGWCMFGTNTIMTGAIIGKILYVSRSSSNGALMPHYGVLIEAITESAAVTWVGLLFYEIATTAPTHGKITDELNIGYVLICILPLFFGISNCLITVRLGLAGDRLRTSNFSCSDNTGTFNGSAGGLEKFQARAITVTMSSNTSSNEQMTFAEKAVAEMATREL